MPNCSKTQVPYHGLISSLFSFCRSSRIFLRRASAGSSPSSHARRIARRPSTHRVANFTICLCSLGILQTILILISNSHHTILTSFLFPCHPPRPLGSCKAPAWCCRVRACSPSCPRCPRPTPPRTVRASSGWHLTLKSNCMTLISYTVDIKVNTAQIPEKRYCDMVVALTRVFTRFSSLLLCCS